MHCWKLWHLFRLTSIKSLLSETRNGALVWNSSRTGFTPCFMGQTCYIALRILYKIAPQLLVWSNTFQTKLLALFDSIQCTVAHKWLNATVAHAERTVVHERIVPVSWLPRVLGHILQHLHLTMNEWTIKTPNPICRLFFKIDLLTDFAAVCLTDFIDWRYIYSWLVFSTRLVNCCPHGRRNYTCAHLPSLWPPPSPFPN